MYFVTKQIFYIKKQLFDKNIFCKKAAFLQKYIFLKKQYFYNRLICKKAAFLHKNDAFLQGPFFMQIYIYIYIYKYLYSG